MPSATSPSWNERFEYHLQQSLLALGGTVSLNEYSEPSWHNRVEELLKEIAANIGNAGGGGSGGGLNSYYSNLLSLGPAILAPLDDGGIFAREATGDIYGQYTGGYTQQQASLLSDVTAKSCFFNEGAVAVNYLFPSPQALTLAVQFLATDGGAGGFFGFGSDTSFSSPNNDRQVYFTTEGNIRVRVWTGSEQLLTTPSTYKDNQVHTLVVRVGGGLNTIISIDGTIVAESGSPINPVPYTGFWKIGHALVGQGFAKNITMQGAAIFQKALTNAQIASIHANR